MAKKGRAKISKVKRNNQTTNKMRKKGQLRLQRHTNNPQKNKQPVQQPQMEYSSESDEASGDEWGDMLDEEEQKYIMSRLAKQPQLLSNVPEKEQENKNKKRKRENKERPPKRIATGSDSGAESDDDSDSDVEGKYEKELAERPPKRLRPLLPIKTKEGLMERSEEVDDTESEQEDAPMKQAPQDTEAQDSASDSGVEGTGEEGEAPDADGVVSAVELLAARRDRLRNDKLRIGALCSSLLESPEKKLKNLYPILYLMEERLKDGTLNLHSIRKLASLSAYEVFKDILPDYQIRHQDYSNIKLKKDTLSLYKYEKELLEFYKRYLQRLERAAGVMRRKKGDTRKPDSSSLELAIVSLRCMCGMLEARPGFNYATNIAQSVVPFLESSDERARAIVAAACTAVFHQDNKGEITLAIVRLINQLVKRRGSRLHPAALQVLLTLNIKDRDIDMDAHTDLQQKKKQDEKHKKRIINLSKKEKKRSKKLKEVERELLETQAQESALARKKLLTEVTRTVFQIYFRLLKNAPRSKLLAAVLDGLAKFTHVINLEYYSDLVSILARLIADEDVGARERLLVVRTVLAVLSGAGDSLNVDPAKFHAYLYAHALDVHAGRSHPDAHIVLEAVQQICARARRVSSSVLQALAKRTATLGTQLLHNGALACLVLLHNLAQQSKAVSTLLDLDTEGGGSGRFEPTLPSPEHCNAHAATLHDLAALRTHYHPTVRATAAAVLHHKLPQELDKLSPTQILNAYDGSQMSFKPSIPPPKKCDKQPKRTASHVWVQPSFKQLCESIENNTDLIIKDNIR